MSTENSEEKKGFIWFVLLCASMCLVGCIFYVLRLAPELPDTDCYWRLNRVQMLYEGSGWYETKSFRSNAPYGESLHWTRPLDVLLMAGAIPASAFVDFKTALFWWGVFISPVLFFCTLMVVPWATRPILGRQEPFFLGILFFFQAAILAVFLPGRCDQHSLLLLLFVVLFGFGLRIISGPLNRWVCYAAGVVGGLSIWVGLESILVVFTIAAIFGLLWIWEKGDFAQKSISYGSSLFAMVSISMLLERPLGDLATQEFDRISIVHWSICGFLAGFWIIAGLINRFSEIFSRRTARLIFAVSGAGLAAISVWYLFPKMWQSFSICFLFPKFYSGQVADVGPRLVEVWHERVGELQHMYSRNTWIAMAVQFTGTMVISVPFLLYLLSRKDCRNKRGWHYVLILLFVFIPPSIYRIRWASYPQFLFMLPMAGVMDMALKSLQKQKAGVLRALKYFLFIMIFSATFLALGIAAEVIAGNKQAKAEDKKVSLVKICRYLNEDQKWLGRNVRILTNMDFGPEIIYRTRHEVIGTPYHRNWRGILDTYDIMTAEEDETAHKLVEQRKVELILLSLKLPELGDRLKIGDKSTFYQRLCRNECPNWLRAIELLDELAVSFKLFEVARGGN